MPDLPVLTFTTGCCHEVETPRSLFSACGGFPILSSPQRRGSRRDLDGDGSMTHRQLPELSNFARRQYGMTWSRSRQLSSAANPNRRRGQRLFATLRQLPTSSTLAA